MGSMVSAKAGRPFDGDAHRVAGGPLGRLAKHAADDCSAGKPYCYDAPVHLDSPINTPGFEGKPALSSDGLELYFVSDRPGALGGPGIRTSMSAGETPSTAPGCSERVPSPGFRPSSTSRPRSARRACVYFGSNRPGPFSPPWPDPLGVVRASVNHPGPGGESVALASTRRSSKGRSDISPTSEPSFSQA